MEECIHHGESRDWWRRCSDRAERGGRQENVIVDLFQDDLRCLFSPHQVNHGGVQKAPTQVSLYKSHMTEEPLRRRRSGRY